MKKKILLFALMIFLLSSNFTYAFETVDYYEEMFKIGIYFESSSKDRFLLGGNESLNIYDNDKDKLLLHLSEPNMEVLSSKMVGDYYIKYDKTFLNYQDAKSYSETLKSSEPAIYYYDDGNWYIIYGYFINDLSAERFRNEELNNISNLIIDKKSKEDIILSSGNTPVFSYNSTQNIIMNNSFRNITNINNKNYRGSLQFKINQSDRINVINHINLEEYLYGVLPREMPTSWHVEALKAQAVTARSFAIANKGKYSNLGFDLCNTTASQVYGGYDIETPEGNTAVDLTRGEVLIYNGNVVSAFYHSNSGGFTENSENIWSAELQYVRGVEDPYSLNQNHSNWTETFTREEVNKILRDNNIFIGEVIDMEIVEKSPNNRVNEMKIIGTEGEKTLYKEESRFLFGLRSNMFDISSSNQYSENKIYFINESNNKVELEGEYLVQTADSKIISNSREINIVNKNNFYKIENRHNYALEDVFVFNGHGFGHGVGMSQHGAKVMAESGYNHTAILNFYFTDIEVANIYENK